MTLGTPSPPPPHSLLLLLYNHFAPYNFAKGVNRLGFNNKRARGEGGGGGTFYFLSGLCTIEKLACEKIMVLVSNG